MSDEPIKIIKVPTSPFVFGDDRYRVLYGPETEQGTRPLVGVIREDMVSPLEELLERAEAIPDHD